MLGQDMYPAIEEELSLLAYLTLVFVTYILLFRGYLVRVAPT